MGCSNVKTVISLIALCFCPNNFAVNSDEKIDLSQFGWEIYGKPIQQNSRNYKSKFGNPEERGPYLEGSNKTFLIECHKLISVLQSKEIC